MARGTSVSRVRWQTAAFSAGGLDTAAFSAEGLYTAAFCAGGLAAFGDHTTFFESCVIVVFTVYKYLELSPDASDVSVSNVLHMNRSVMRHRICWRQGRSHNG